MSRRDERRDELRAEYREAKARELELDGWAAEARELRGGRCACLCGRRLGSGVRAFYVDTRHRQAFHRRRLARAAEAAGVPPRLSLQALQASNRSHDRSGDAPARPRARERRPLPGVRVYLPSVELAESLEQAIARLEALGWSELYATRELRDAIAPALERRRRREAA